MERAGVGQFVGDLFVACATVAGYLIFHIAGDAFGSPLDGLGTADQPHFAAVGARTDALTRLAVLGSVIEGAAGAIQLLASF